jgi:hypothetical protein
MVGGMSKPDSTAVQQQPQNAAEPVAHSTDATTSKAPAKRPREIGGPSGLEPTRYGDWERNGRVSDF